MRDIECYLNDQTLKDLVATYLQTVCLIKSSEEVSDLTLSAPNDAGVRTIRFKIEPDIQTIHHI